MENYKYEKLAVVTECFGDFKVLAYVSGNTKAEVIRKVKEDSGYNIRRNGLVSIDHPDFPQRINSNRL